jgi:predicted Fe-Mo cluster-binding NifX family protein
MNICIPVEQDLGLKSAVFGHFGSAPLFMIADTETGLCRAVVNSNEHHSHGMCQPLAALSNENLGAVVVSGIGGGALNKLHLAGIKVFRATPGTVEETLAAFRAGTLEEFAANQTCGGHQHGQQHQCGHKH